MAAILEVQNYLCANMFYCSAQHGRCETFLLQANLETKWRGIGLSVMALCLIRIDFF